MTERPGGVPVRRVGTVVLALVVCLAAVGSPLVTAETSAQAEGTDDEAGNESVATVVPSNDTTDNRTVVPEQPTEQPEPPTEEPEPPGPVARQGPEADVTVSLEDDDEAITAGDVGTVALEVTNDENDDVTDVVVTLRTAGSPLFLGAPSDPQATRTFYLDEVAEDATETLEVDVGTDRTASGTYPLFATVEYVEDEGDEPTVGGPTALGVAAEGEREFRVENVTDRVTIDSENAYEVRITNEGDEAATGVVATMETAPPLSSASPTAFVGTLDPGESRTARFALEVSEDAVATRDSVAVTIGYETEAGTDERTTTGPTLVPVTIAEDEDEADVDTLAPFVVVGVVLVLAAVWWLRRR